MTLFLRLFLTALVLHFPAFAICMVLYGPHGPTDWVFGSLFGMEILMLLAVIWRR